jgi:hypothetical protein
MSANDPVVTMSSGYYVICLCHPLVITFLASGIDPAGVLAVRAVDSDDNTSGDLEPTSSSWETER